VIGEATQVHVDDYATIELDLIAVRGKREATRIFALLGRDDVANRTEFKELAQLHRDMITAYREREWAVARRIVHRCRSLQIVRAFDLTALYDLYDLRIADFEINPPPADWAGTHVAESK
jgi:adenylate cyclase